MSTSAESALEWLDKAKPRTEEIQVVILKLESRIKNSGSPESLIGEIEALALLQQVLLDATEYDTKPIETAEITAPAPESYTLTTNDQQVHLDVTPLGDPASGVDEKLSADARRMKFLALKKQLSQSS